MPSSAVGAFGLISPWHHRLGEQSLGRGPPYVSEGAFPEQCPAQADLERYVIAIQTGDFYCNRDLDAATIVHGIATTWDIPSACVLAIDEPEFWSGLDDLPLPRAGFWVDQGKAVAGEFHMAIFLVVQTDGDSRREINPQRAAVFARAVGCQVLIADGSPNPYAFLLADGSLTMKRVGVDVDLCDSDPERLVIDWDCLMSPVRVRLHTDIGDLVNAVAELLDVKKGAISVVRDAWHGGEIDRHIEVVIEVESDGVEDSALVYPRSGLPWLVR